MYVHEPLENTGKGDVIQDLTDDKLHIVKHVTHTGFISLGKPYGEIHNESTFFKKVKTLPGYEAKVGDTIIFIRDTIYSEPPKEGQVQKGEIHTVTGLGNSTETYVTYGKPITGRNTKTGEYGVQFSGFLILCKEQEMKISDYIVDIKDSSLMDRLRLRQVLIDNDQELFCSSAGMWKIKDVSMKVVKLMKIDNVWAGSIEHTPNISLEDFISKFKKHDQVRNIAYYKKSGKNWVLEEILRVPNSCTSLKSDTFNRIKNHKFLFDSTEYSHYMYPWTSQKVTHCLQVAYEDAFPQEEDEYLVEGLQSITEPGTYEIPFGSVLHQGLCQEIPIGPVVECVSPYQSIKEEPMKNPFKPGDIIRSLTVKRHYRGVGSLHKVTCMNTDELLWYQPIIGSPKNSKDFHEFELVSSASATTETSEPTTTKKEETMRPTNSVPVEDQRTQPKTFQQIIEEMFGPQNATDLVNKPQYVAHVFDESESLAQIIAVDSNEAVVKMLQKDPRYYLGYVVSVYKLYDTHTLNVPVKSERPIKKSKK